MDAASPVWGDGDRRNVTDTVCIGEELLDLWRNELRVCQPGLCSVSDSLAHGHTSLRPRWIRRRRCSHTVFLFPRGYANLAGIVRSTSVPLLGRLHR